MQPRIALHGIGVSQLLAASAAVTFAQTSTSAQSTTGDPQAVAPATRALVALGAAQVGDVTLTGTVMRTVGPDSEAGTITLKGLGLTQGRMDLSLPNGTLTEVRGVANGGPVGSWISNGTAQAIPNHSLMVALDTLKTITAGDIVNLII